MNLVSRILYLLAALVNAAMEVFCVLMILCAYVPQLNLAPHLSGLFPVFEDQTRVAGAAVQAVMLLVFSFLLYFIGSWCRRSLKKHTHRLVCHIFALILSIYYFSDGLVIAGQIFQVPALGYVAVAGGILYFVAAITGMIAHNR